MNPCGELMDPGGSCESVGNLKFRTGNPSLASFNFSLYLCDSRWPFPSIKLPEGTAMRLAHFLFPLVVAVGSLTAPLPFEGTDANGFHDRKGAAALPWRRPFVSVEHLLDGFGRIAVVDTYNGANALLLPREEILGDKMILVKVAATRMRWGSRQRGRKVIAKIRAEPRSLTGLRLVRR